MTNESRADGMPEEATAGTGQTSTSVADSKASAEPQHSKEKNDKAALLNDVNLMMQGKPLPASDPKNRSINYTKDTDAYRSQIESPEWQQAHADRRNFAVFGRNYINRIHCAGTIADVLYPTTKGVELEIKNNGHDLFLRIGSDVPGEFTHFPVDMNVICDGSVFQINGVVDSQYPATNLELVLDADTPTAELKRYDAAVRKAGALPHEERIAKILRRIWNDEPLPYWQTKRLNTSFGNGQNTVMLRQTVKTGISDITAWDFSIQNRELPVPALLSALRDKVEGEIIALGRVSLKSSQRAILLTAPTPEFRKVPRSLQ